MAPSTTQGAGLMAAGLLLSATAAGTEARPAAVQRPPNIVIIFADDMGYGDLACFGNKVIRTPNFDRMAAEGVKLTQFYVPCSVCSPSRAALLTGRYPIRTGFTSVLVPNTTNGLDDTETTPAQALKTRGYATACIGKWHLGHLPPHLPTRHGFDRYFGIPYSNDMGPAPGGAKNTPLMRGEKVIEQPVDQDTLTKRYTEEAIRFIHDEKDGPFFLYLPHAMPHIPIHASDTFRGKSAGGLYGDVVQEMDWSTGRILDTLKELGLDSNTLVIFTSDNGPWLKAGESAGSAGPLRDGKFSVYEGGIREPFLARWPGHIPAGRVSDEAVISVDLFTTVSNLAGVKPSGNLPVDGKDIRGVLDGSGHRDSHEFYFSGDFDNPKAYRDGRWKLHLPKKVNGHMQAAELYDMEADPGEANDLAAKEPERVAQMSRRAAAFIANLEHGAAAPKRVR